MSEENKSPIKRTGSVDLDKILKDGDVLYENTGAGVKVVKAIYPIKGEEKTVAAKILTKADFGEVS